MSPDIVLANQEENRRVDVERLRAAGIPVWVTAIRTLDQAFASLRRMFGDALGWPEPGWLAEAEQVWPPPPRPPVPAVIAIWRDPWMVVGSDTFTGDLATRPDLVRPVPGQRPGPAARPAGRRSLTAVRSFLMAEATCRGWPVGGEGLRTRTTTLIIPTMSIFNLDCIASGRGWRWR